MLPRNVIFDLDGTLVDSLPGIEYSLRSALEPRGYTLPESGVRPFIGPPVREMITAITGERDPLALDALESAFRRSYDSDGWKKTGLAAGAKESLEWLRSSGCVLYLVTNKPQGPAQRIVQHLGIRDFFERHLSPDSKIPPYGSKSEMVRTIMEEEGSAPEWLLVGDSAEDFAAAAEAGIAAVILTGGYGTPVNAPGCRRIGTLGELGPAMAGIGGRI